MDGCRDTSRKNWTSKKERFRDEPSIIYNDTQANHTYPNLRWIYNKYQLMSYLQTPCGTFTTSSPPSSTFPVYAKPKTNFLGMGLNSTKLISPDEWKRFQSYLDTSVENYFWQPYYQGTHWSIDLVFEQGFLQQSVWFYAKKENDVQFTAWTLAYIHSNKSFHEMYDINHDAKQRIETILQLMNDHSFTGIINIEMIGSHIIEIHLRMGDICHLPHIDQSIRSLYTRGQWIPLPEKKNIHKSPFHLIPCFVPPQPTYIYPWLEQKLENEPSILHYQICRTYPTFDELFEPFVGSIAHEYRICNFAVTSLEEGLRIQTSILSTLSPKDKDLSKNP